MPDSNSFIGRTMGRYRIVEEVGRGGMAVVYRAVDEMLGREVAVKVLHAHLAGEPESRARLQREAQAVAKLRHENILEIFDYSGPEQSESYIVTEFIRGQTLTAFLAKQSFPVPEVAELVVAEIAGALEHAHGFGVIHRDVKPENVMIRDDGRVKLMDFGIAQIVDKERLTATGQLIGSPAYLAPELVAGGRVDLRTDVFAVGIVLYRLATGQLPFSGRNPHEVMKKIVDGRFTPPDQLNPLIGTALARMIARALAREPDARYPTTRLLRDELLADAAAAGLVDVRGELARFFADPVAWEKAARPRMVASLIEGARREAASRRTAASMALAARALSLDPRNFAARAIVNGIGRRRVLANVALGAGAAAVIITGGAFGVRRFEHAKALRLVSEPVADARGGRERTRGDVRESPAAMKVTARQAIDTSAADARKARLQADQARVRALARPAVRPPEEQILVSVIQKNSEVFVDDIDRHWAPNSPISVDASRDHLIEIRNRQCYPRVFHTAVEPKLPAIVRLDWKPATLTVSTEPRGATIFLTGLRSPTLLADGVARPIPIPREQNDPRLALHVRVSAPGYESKDEDIEVLAGSSPPPRKIVLNKAP